MDLLLSAQQKTGQLSAPLSFARLLPFPSWTAKRKICVSCFKSIFLHGKHNASPQHTQESNTSIKIHCNINGEAETGLHIPPEIKCFFDILNYKGKKDSSRSSASNRKTKGNSRQALYFTEETELLDQLVLSKIMLYWHLLPPTPGQQRQAYARFSCTAGHSLAHEHIQLTKQAHNIKMAHNSLLLNLL